jgi:hypothetical protein
MTFEYALNARIRMLGMLILTICLFCFSPAIAESAPLDLGPVIAITEGKTEQSFAFLSGGVSTDEREVMEQKRKAYNVKLSFAEKRGPYLSDIKLEIRGPKGAEIISTTTNGPWFFIIQLPQGTYSVKATFNGQMKEIRNLAVPKNKAVQQTLVWDLGRAVSRHGLSASREEALHHRGAEFAELGVLYR